MSGFHQPLKIYIRGCLNTTHRSFKYTHISHEAHRTKMFLNSVVLYLIYVKINHHINCKDFIQLFPKLFSPILSWFGLVNTLRPSLNGGHCTDDNFKRVFLNENVKISIEISLKPVPKGRINIIPSLVQIMAWRWPGNKPLSEPSMFRSPTHICVNRPQWVKE